MSTIVTPARDAATTPGQPPRLADIDLVGCDRALMCALHAYGAGALEEEARAFGVSRAAVPAGRGLRGQRASARARPLRPLGGAAGRHRLPSRLARVLGAAVEGGVAGGAWADDRPGAHVARAAKFIAIAQAEAGVTCPIAMTHSCVPACG